MSETVQSVIKEIKDNLSQRTASTKDEICVMQTMLNDKTYKVGVFNKNGQVDTYCPAEEARAMSAITISQAAHISMPEAENLMESYEYSKKEAQAMIGISKEFINTYLQTDRKINLGGREKSDVSLLAKHNEAGVRRYPISGLTNGATASGTTQVPAYDAVKVVAPCPTWLKKK